MESRRGLNIIGRGESGDSLPVGVRVVRVKWTTRISRGELQNRSTTASTLLHVSDDRGRSCSVVSWVSNAQGGEAMADTIRQIDYFYMLVPHKTGEGARILRTLKDTGVNLLAFSGFPEGGARNSISSRPTRRRSRVQPKPTSGRWSARNEGS